MKKLLWAFLIFGCVAFAQGGSDNVAADALKKRVLGMDLLHPQKRFEAPKAVIVAAPKTCAVPLLEAKPAATGDRMQTATPRLKPLAGDVVDVPAPPCGPAAK
jgi:hypothetical protein